MKTFIFVCCCFLAATFLQAQIIHVPGDYNMIQQGINAANPGDTILVADGIYYEQINFMGKKPLMVASGYLTDGNESHIANTIIDGSQFPDPDNASVVYFITGEDSTSILCGFTIQNGTGTFYQYQKKNDTMSFQAGGGIFISGSGAKIIHNHITQNHLNYNLLVDKIDLPDGSAIATEWKIDDNWVVIEHNLVDLNTCISANLQAGGAGINVYCNSRIAYNTLTNNTSTGLENSSAMAGGLACATDPAWNNTVTAIVHHNTISNNLVQAVNNYATSAGAAFQHVTGTFQNNIVIDNEVITWSESGGGAGFMAYIPLDGLIVSGNTFSGNSCNLWGGGIVIESIFGEIPASRILVENNYFFNNHGAKGGAMVIFSTPVCLQNNVFSGNIADQVGGALLLWKDLSLPMHHMATVINNSFHGNSAATGGAIYSVRSRPLVLNSVFNGDSTTMIMGQEIYIAYIPDTMEISYSNIDMGLVYGNVDDGGGIITADPLFEDTLLLTLLSGSPCIDSGTESFTCDCGDLHTCPLYDISFYPRPNGVAFDIGAHEKLQPGGIPQLPGENLSAWHHVYPNPANQTVTFEYKIVIPGYVQLAIYDLTGKAVAIIANEYQATGKYKAEWNAQGAPSGVYFYRLTTDDYRLTTSGKLVIAR
jgi:hypothetical protein